MTETTFEIPDTPPPTEEVTISAAEPVDPAAPYGRFANGKPRKAPPSSKVKAPRTAPAPKAGPPRPPKGKTADYRPVVEKAFQGIALGLTALGRRDRRFLADAATVQMSAKQGAQVLNDVAQINPVVERLLATSAPAVPYMELAGFLFGLGAQLAANHGVKIPLPGVELHDPADLANGMESQLRQVAEAQQQAERQAQEQAREAGPAATAAEHAHAFAMAG